jgi:phosphoglucosamine mutase
MQKKYFGTDGIRGKVGNSIINPEFVLKLGWAAGKVFTASNQNKVLIGKDTRISGYMLESALEAGLSAAGANVALLGPMPTPAIAYLTRTLHAAAGIVISASHNQFEDNGIKFFSAEGTKVADEIELKIEAELEKSLSTVASINLGKARRIADAPGRYIEFCKGTIPSLTRFSGLKIVLDCANGATYHIAPHVFSELGADVITIGNSPDGFNINHRHGSTAPEHLQKQVLAHNADLGIAFDGDGDRVIMVDHKGNLVNGDQILYLITMERLQNNNFQGGVVGTQMTNLGLEQNFRKLKIPFVRTKVGDRYVMQELLKHNWKIGGESSGHIVCLDKTTTGDGIVSALQAINYMIHQQKSLSELLEDLQMVPQYLINIPTSHAEKIMSNIKIKQWVDNFKNNTDGRVLLRASGTEPLIRLLIEGFDNDTATQYSNDFKNLINCLQ